MVERISTIGKLPIAVQVAAIALLSMALTLVLFELNYRTSLNAIWMIAFPFLLGVSVNHTTKRRLVMASILTGVSLLTVMIVGGLMGGI